MNTKSHGWRANAAAVTGARHLRAARNGQDAAAAWVGEAGAAIAVCDGCSEAASSEVGARLGAALVVRALADRLAAGASPADPAVWDDVRADVARALAALLAHLPGAALRDSFLFTIVAAAATRDAAAVWALGDGGYALDGGPHALGPVADNAPPYLAYDLEGAPRAAHFAPTTARAIVIASDGLAPDALPAFARPRFVDHPDALRRELAVRARADERIAWDERRVVRTPAALQDDGAVGVLLGSAS